MRTSTRLAAKFLLISGLLAGASGAHAALLTNGSFEAVDASGAPYYVRSFSSTPGWTQIGDGVDLIHNDYTQGPSVLVDASNGVQFLDMNQAGVLGGIQQTVAATAGTTYRLDFDATAWATNSRGGTLGYSLFDPLSSTVLASGSVFDGVGGTWIPVSLEAIAISSMIGVRIESLAATQAALGLDNVRLNVVPPAAVPLPGGLALLPGALAALGLTANRSRRRGA